MALKVTGIKTHWIIDSRALPTVEVKLYSKDACAFGSAASGASTGSLEAIELRDNGKEFQGKGVEKALQNIRSVSKKIIGKTFETQMEFDDYLIKLDGTQNKSNLGGNSTTALSTAFFSLLAKSEKMKIHELFSKISGERPKMPTAMFNIINGGKHAGNDLAIQEFMIIPQNEKIERNIQYACEIYAQLKKDIEKRHGKICTAIGDEGGFSPPLKKTEDALELITTAIDKAGYSKSVKIGIDSAADSFYNEKTGKYSVDGKMLESMEMVDYYLNLEKKFKLLSIEDPFFEKDMYSFAELNKKSKSLIIGDDLTVTNSKIIGDSAKKGAMGGVILKLNQIGTVSETLDASKTARKHRIKRIVSHRSGETESAFISNLAYGIGAEFIKTGAPARGERTAKYNQLLRIERGLEE